MGKQFNLYIFVYFFVNFQFSISYDGCTFYTAAHVVIPAVARLFLFNLFLLFNLFWCNLHLLVTCFSQSQYLLARRSVVLLSHSFIRYTLILFSTCYVQWCYILCVFTVHHNQNSSNSSSNCLVYLDKWSLSMGLNMCNKLYKLCW
jgi:hypothetical protein